MINESKGTNFYIKGVVILVESVKIKIFYAISLGLRNKFLYLQQNNVKEK
jgi:hypothetical protein